MTCKRNSGCGRRTRRLTSFKLAAFCATLLVTAGGAAQTCDYTVTSTADSGTGSLRAGFAVLASAGGTNICFGVTGTISLATPLEVTLPVNITGSSAVTISGGNQVQLMVISPSASTDAVTISGLNLTGGFATTNMNQPGGGAIWVQQGVVTLSGVTISSSSGPEGGGIFNQGTVILTNSTISGNTSSIGLGGGIANLFGATLSLSNTTITGNASTAGDGGGLSNDGNLQIIGSTFSQNQGADGGAVYNDVYGQMNISGGTRFNANSASQGGGAIYNAGVTNITQTLFTGNTSQGAATAAACGGAMCNVQAATITESTFTSNTTAGSGGALENFGGGSLTLDDDTMVGNTASVAGSGLDVESTAIPSINNTIISGNTTIPGAANSDCSGCLSGNGLTNLIAVTANLGPLANNGGPTQTMMPLPGGAAVGTGTVLTTLDVTDQRGFSRVNGNSVDIGAVQSHYSSVAFSTQPSAATVNTTITPPVAVQVIEVDGSTTNYPQGVPVMLSLETTQGVQVTGVLSGTLTESPTVSNGVTAASFSDLAANTAGSYELFATAAIPSNSASADPAYSATSNVFQISNPIVVTLSWQPAPATYGPIPQSELNATATVNGAPGTGSFIYTFTQTGTTINVGQVYPVAAYGVRVAFTPTGSTTQYTLSTTMQITQATPVLTWAMPAPIFMSTRLSATQLDATATGVTGAALPGAFVYKPTAGTALTAGAQTLTTTFTPTDTTDYTTATAQVTIQVKAPTPAAVAIQESANPITFGQSETLTAVVTGSDGNPYSGGTATFTVNGTALTPVAIVNGSGSVAVTSLKGGTHQIGVTYTNGTNPSLNSSTTLTVNKATPKLMWATPAAILTSTVLSTTQLDAAAAGVTGAALAGTFVYNPAAGTTLAAGAHTLSVTFTPTDATDYNTPTAQVTIHVNSPTASTVVVQASPNPARFGQTVTLTATVTGSDGKPFSGGTAVFTSDGSAVGTVAVASGTATATTSSLAAGSHAIVVTYTNSTLSQPLIGSTTLVINKATPVLTWPTPAPIFPSTALSATQLDATAAGVKGAALAGTFVYNPTAGTALAAGAHTLSATFTPTDTTDYNAATAQVTIQVNSPSASTVMVQDSPNPAAFGQTVTLTATVTGSDGKPFSGGTATFTSDGNAAGSATVVNGVATVATASLPAGTHAIVVTYTNSTLSRPLTGSTTLVINKATPVLSWTTPASINTVTPLSGTQLDATAAGVGGAALPGAFVYSPAAGTVLTVGSHTLSTTFTPTDTTDYTTATAQATIQVTYAPITITTVSPNTTPLSSNPAPITITGTGFTATSVVEVNGSSLATTAKSEASLSASIPVANLASTGTLNLSVYDPTTKFTSNVIPFTVTAPAANVSISLPSTGGSGEQPTLAIDVNTPYPTTLIGTLTLTFASSGSSGVDDPAIQFSTGGRTLTFTVPAASTTTPQVALQTGTVAGTITVTLTLSAGGVDVTPSGLAPITLVIAPAVPTITSVSFTSNSTGLVTVVINGFSNTRDMSQADFTFTGSGADSLASSKATISVTGLFSPWYSSTTSDQYGSEFTYTQNFQLSRPDSAITGVSVTLQNSVGTSGSVNSQ